jgi:hypothetical protein
MSNSREAFQNRLTLAGWLLLIAAGGVAAVLASYLVVWLFPAVFTSPLKARYVMGGTWIALVASLFFPCKWVSERFGITILQHQKGETMGAEAWDYFVPYEDDIQSALNKLREREFRAGRFHHYGQRPATIEEVLAMSDEDGTRSILDITTVADQPDFCTVAPLSEEALIDLFGTTQPTRRMIEGNHDFYENIERGQGVYIVAYEGDRPSEIFFAGYSFD